MSYVLCAVAIVLAGALLVVCVDVVTKPVGPSLAERFLCLVIVLVLGYLILRLVRAMLL